MTGNRRRVVTLLVVVAVVLATGVAAAVFLPRAIERGIDGGGAVTIRVPWTADAPTTETLPAITAADLPLATLPVTRPVRIESDAFLLRQAELTFSYDGLALPPGVDPVDDVVVLVRVPELDLWTPVDTEVDPEAATATVSTPHFSEWVLGVTDPEVLRNQQILADRLKRSAGGVIARVVWGDRSPLGCSPDRPLLPALIRDATTLSPEVCQELRADGGYRLDYVNTSGMPRLLTLPPGFVRQDAMVRSTNQLFADALAVRHPGTAVVMDGEAITLHFADADVDPDTRITGTTDWNVYLISVVRLLGAAMLIDDRKKNPDPVVQVLDRVLLSGKLWDCLDKFSDEIRSAGPDRLANAAVGVIEKCAGEVVDAIVTVLREQLRGIRASVKFLATKLRRLLDVPELMELARAEINGLFTVAGGVLGVDLSLTIDPARQMSADEAGTLPLTPLWSSDSGAPPGCVTLPVGTVVAGMPEGSCVGVVEADLDGNDEADRLLLWRPPLTGSPNSDDVAARAGAVAFLDDGGVAPLEDPPASWTGGGDSVSYLDASRLVRLGPDPRQQVLVTVAVGANTTHHVALTVGADRRLRTVTHESGLGPFRFYGGGGAGYSSGFGCVTSRGAPLVASVGSITMWGGGDGPDRYGWTRTFDRLDDTVLRHVGREGGVSTDMRMPPEGGDCAAVDPAARGPEIGVPGRAPTSPEQTAAEFLTAVLDDDRSGVSRLLSGTGVEDEWAGGRGSDPWFEARRATQDDRASWRSATLDCKEPPSDTVESRNCVYVRPGRPIGLYLRVVAGPDGWTVSGALGSPLPA